MTLFTHATTVALTTSSVMAVSAISSPAMSSSQIAERILTNDALLLKHHQARRLIDSDFSSAPIRKLEDSELETCDTEFLNCLSDPKCVDCFSQMQHGKIDWTGVTSEVTCADVVSLLNDGGYCTGLKGDSATTSHFCDTFDACVIWDNQDDDDHYDPSEEEGWVNCTALTQCKWPGMKESWLGDGICHENMHGCYNTAICGWDGGDCCQDTCDDGFSQFKKCGQDGFACRDPASVNCDPNLSSKCPIPSGGSTGTEFKCPDNEQKYRLILYDSFGDGWDGTEIRFTNAETGQFLYKGSLKEGSQATEYICLPKSESCINAVTSGGTWGVEVSWEVKSMKEGSPALAAAGAPSRCQFPIAGGTCDLTCDGRDDIDTAPNSDYSTLKNLSDCIEDKCVIQVGACKKDEACNRCFVEKSPDYCYALDSFNAVIDCTMCSCSKRHHDTYCKKKDGPGAVVPAETERDNDNSAPKECSGAETMSCVESVMDFSTCTPSMDATALSVQFDQSNFGQLDQFERCAHEYADAENHGGHRALNCMGILYNAMNNPTASDHSKHAPEDAIAALAKSLYLDAENFCDCATKSSNSCALCPAFMNFKTLLYESLDACSALDEIDCAAWEEFSPPCQRVLNKAFKNSDLDSREQCVFVKDQCGGAGAFPSFRRLDCRGEIDDDAWDFYLKYERNCLRGGGDDKKPNSSPVQTPSIAPAASPASEPTTAPYIPSDDDIRTSSPYVPADAKGSSKSKASTWSRNLLIVCMMGGLGFYIYKKRMDNFTFVRYRRVQNHGNFGYDMHTDDSSGLYSNLNSSTNFEPPTLPPTPQMMSNSHMYGGNTGAPGMHGYPGATEMT